MDAMRFTATITILLFFAGQPAVAQEANVPEHFTQFCDALVGSWEGDMVNSTPDGAEQTIPIMCEYKKILNGKAIYGDVVLTVTPDFIVEVTQILAWDAMQQKVVLFEVADNGEVAHSVGTKPDFLELGYSLVMSKDIDKGKYEATTVMSLPDADRLLYKVRFSIDGEVAINQKITLDKQ